MINKLKSRKHLLLFAAAILSLSFIVAITAYLTDKDNFATSIRTASKSDIDIEITGEEVEGLVTHGEKVELNPVVSNDGVIPVFLFAEVDMDAGLTPALADGWTQYLENVYYYGDGELIPLEPNNTITVFDSVTVDAESEQNAETEQQDLNISVNAYALQTGGIDKADIDTAWSLASSTVNP